MSQYLGDISAYALAVSQGYTGTEEEYAELMASYATVGQTAVTAAQTATTKASEAATSATTATNKATEATTAATTATNKAAEAQADADAAALDASQAMSAASTATSKAAEATTAAATATSAATTATTAKDDAVSAKTAAQTAQAGAETAAASVQSSAAQIQTNADDISELKEELTNSNDGVQTFRGLGNFQHYGLNTNGSFLLTQKYRVSNDDPMTFDRSLTISVKSGFRWGYCEFANNTVTWRGWFTTPKTIVAGTTFEIQIARVTEVTSEIANVPEFLSALTFNTSVSDEIKGLSDTLDNMLFQFKNDPANIAQNVIWVQGVVTDQGEYSQSFTIRTDYIDVTPYASVDFSCDSGYKYFYLTYDKNKTFISAISQTTGISNLTVKDTNIKYVRLNLRNTAQTDLTPAEYVHMSAIGLNVLSNISSISKRLNVIENVFRHKPFFSHIGVGKSTNVIIPSQSIADVQKTKRLGFDALEINVLKTSDNQYVCLHGSGGKFGAAFIGADSSDVSNIAVSSVTMDWIKSNVRFVSNYPKYQTAPPTLAEMLTECKKNGIIPAVQYVDMNMVDILNKIMGLDNYILNIYGADRLGKTDAVCISWTAIPDIEDAIAKCQSSGMNYILAVDWSNSAFSEFTDDDWADYVRAIHKAGYYVGSAYVGNNIFKFMAAGFDVIASSGTINEITDGNLCNLDSGVDFEDYTITNGSVSNGTLVLSQWGTVTPNEQLPTVFLGGGSLHIRFSGKIYMHMGVTNETLKSDGNSDVWVSSFFEESAPTFNIEAAQETQIFDLTYKASKM